MDTKPAVVATSSHPQLMPIGQLLSHSFEMVKKRLGGFLALSIIPLVLAGIVGVIIAGIFIGVIAFLGVSGFEHMKPESIIPLATGGIILFLFFVLLLGLLQSWCGLALLYFTIDESLSIGASFQKAKGKILSFWGLSLLMAFVITGGIMLFIIPGILFYIWFSFAIFIFAAEGVRGVDALQKSKAYVSGYGVEVFIRIFVIFLLSIAIQIFVSILRGITHSEWASTLLSIAFSLLFSPFATVYLYNVYKSVKDVKKQMAFAPSRKEKNIYLAVGFAGIILSFVFMGFVIYLISLVAPILDKARTKDTANPYKMDYPSPTVSTLQNNTQYQYDYPTPTPSSKSAGGL